MDKMFFQALQAVIRHGVTVPPIVDPTSVHSGFGTGGDGTIEYLNWIGKTTDIYDRLLLNPVRSIWLDQAIGMALWNLRGSDSLSDVMFYNPNAVRFTDDNKTIRAPWGKRIMHGGKLSPLAAAVELLRRDPSSLRAVIPIFTEADLAIASRDVPCALAIHFLIRDGGLELICFLRSLNPYWVWPYDHFFFSIVLEFAASLLGIKPRAITYTVSSLQISNSDRPLAERALTCESPVPIHPTPMPSAYSWQHLAMLNMVEKRVRTSLAAACTSNSIVSEDTWCDIVTQGDLWLADLVSSLIYAYLLRHCSSMPALPFPCPPWALAVLRRQYPDKIYRLLPS